MVSARCKAAVKEVLKKLDLHFVIVDLGEVDIMETLECEDLKELKRDLHTAGFELMDDKKAIMIERIKNVIVEMVHHANERPKTNTSDFISEKLSYDYTYLSNMFSEVTGTTIAHFIIAHKIERVKELIIYDEFTLTEISYQMNYSSVAHLSNQFRKITGLSPSHFKQLKSKRRTLIEDIGYKSGEHSEDTP
jgi:AraC-like DNA-binding protein